jgi:flagellar basal body rod protein FlgC
LFDVMSTASAGMAAASSRLEATAGRIASWGATPVSAPQQAPAGGAPVRISYLPLPANASDPIEDMTSMVEDSFAFKFNAVVFKTAAEMLDALYKAVD